MDNTLQRLQNTELEILDEIIRICDANDIHYVMMGGTCLGAIRHKGFIPWDDDIDVGMYREDYNRFKEICKKELDSKYFFQDFDTEKNCGFIFGKIRKNNTYMVEEYAKEIEMHKGIWIDIFPFDYVNDDFIVFQKEYKKLLFLRNLFIVKQGFKVKHDAPIAVKISYSMVRCIRGLLSASSLKNKMMKLMTKYDDTKTNTMFPYGCAWKEKELISKDEFFDTIRVDFEGRKVPVFRSYDKYLTSLYKDYMTPPPIEKRNSGHDLNDVKFDCGK